MSDLLREEIIDAIDEYADLCAAAYGEQLFNEELRKIQLLRDNQKQKLKDLLLVLANQSEQMGDVRDAALEEAAIECDRQGYEESDCPERAAYCAEAIRQMKSTNE